MISFDVGSVKFNYKASGVAIHNSRVLLTRDENTDFWYLPGGRVEVMEATTDTLCREIREELGLEIEVGPLLWVVENFFNLRGTDYHEVALFYSVNFLNCPNILLREGTFEGCEPTVRLFFRWFDIEELENAQLYPHFLRSDLKNIPKVTEHIVVRQRPGR